MARSLFWGYGIWGLDVWGPVDTPPYHPGGGLMMTTPLNPNASWRDGPASFELLITKPGQSSPVTLTTGGVAAAWQTTAGTTLSAEVETADLVRAFQDTDLRAYWLRWEHPSLGVWAGEINNSEPDLTTGTTEIAARDFSALLESRRVTKVYEVEAASAGGLAKRIVVDAAREAGSYTWIQTIAAEETGDPISLNLRGGTVADAMRSLEGKSGDEWWVDENRVLWWQHERGSDKTGSVQLVEGRHVISGRPSFALDPIVNDLLVVPANQPYVLTQQFVLDDDASIIRFGRRQGQLTYTTGATEATLRPAATKDLRKLTRLGDSIQFDVVNVDNCFSWFRDGDSILLLIPQINRTLTVRILVRTYDTDSGILRVSADVEAVA